MRLVDVQPRQYERESAFYIATVTKHDFSLDDLVVNSEVCSLSTCKAPCDADRAGACVAFAELVAVGQPALARTKAAHGSC